MEPVDTVANNSDLNCSVRSQNAERDCGHDDCFILNSTNVWTAILQWAAQCVEKHSSCLLEVTGLKATALQTKSSLSASPKISFILLFYKHIHCLSRDTATTWTWQWGCLCVHAPLGESTIKAMWGMTHWLAGSNFLPQPFCCTCLNSWSSITKLVQTRLQLMVW